MKKNRLELLFFGDCVCMLASFCLATAWRVPYSEMSSFLREAAVPFLALFVIWIGVFFIFDLYTIRRINPNPRTIAILAVAIALNTTIGALLFYFIPSSITPKILLLLSGALLFATVIVWRRLFYFYFSSLSKRSIVLIGTSPELDRLEQELRRHPHLGEVTAKFAAIREFLASAECGRSSPGCIIVEEQSPEEIMLMRKACGGTLLTLRDAYEELFGRIPVSLMTDELAAEFLTEEKHASLAVASDLAGKAIALLILAVASPFLLLAVVAVCAETGGSVIYSQERVGKNGSVFMLYKIRSMRKDAEKDGVVWASSNDGRITKVGRVLRKLHIDELPQMYNVLKGDLALVGPRPERPSFVEKLEKEIPYYYLRHSITPGFTGWAQIKFRYARTVDESREKFEYDLYYIKNGNAFLDAGIALKTIQIVFTH